MPFHEYHWLHLTKTETPVTLMGQVKKFLTISLATKPIAVSGAGTGGSKMARRLGHRHPRLHIHRVLQVRQLVVRHLHHTPSRPLRG